MNDAREITAALEQKYKSVRILKLVFIPYLAFGMAVAVGITGVRGFARELVWITAVAAIVLGAFLAMAIARCAGGKRFLGMDRGLWIFGVTAAILTGAGIVYFGSR